MIPNKGRIPIGYADSPVEIHVNNFVHKSLSSFACNIAVGCGHGCRFCYVPEVSTIKQKRSLAVYGIANPDAEWGRYVLLRPWDEMRFVRSLELAEDIPREHLKPDGNRAVLFCSTSDPYQVFRHPDLSVRRDLEVCARFTVRRALELIRDRSTLNVRILTRSPLAERDFDLFKSFGNRLVFGMSLPTLNDQLSKVYEPNAPGPARRFQTLRKAKSAGLHVFVAMAPTFPECDEADLRRTLQSIADLKPLTVFHEPINIRADNVARIAAQAASAPIDLRTDVFASPQAWRRYACESLRLVERIAAEVGLKSQLHLWPDPSLASKAAVAEQSDPSGYVAWINSWWSRVSEWPSS